MLSPAIRLEPNAPDFNFCLSICAGRMVTVSKYLFVDATKLQGAFCAAT